MRSAILNRILPLLLFALFLNTASVSARTVNDEAGRKIAVPNHPHRLVCLAPSITETVYALGRGDDIVGITDYTKFPPEAKQKQSVGGVIDPSLEKVVSLQPDLVLAIADLNNRDVTQAIERLGLPVFVLDPHGLHDIYRSIKDIGEASDAQREATALVTKLQAREEAVRQRVSGKSKPEVFFLLWPDPITTAGRGAFITELIEVAGGKSMTVDLPNEWPRISFESVLSRQPEYLLLIRGSDVTLDVLRREGNWVRLKAVKNGMVIYADERILFPSPSIFDALEDLANQFHPVDSQRPPIAR